MPAHQLNSGGNRKGLGTEVWGLATRAREPGTDKQTDGRTDRQNDGHFLPPLQTSQSRTRVYNPRTNKQTYQRVSIYLHAGTKLFPERTRLLTSDIRHAVRRSSNKLYEHSSQSFSLRSASRDHQRPAALDVLKKKY